MTKTYDSQFHTTGTWFAVICFLLVFAIGASKPLQLDNMDFPAVGEATAQKGVPVYYRGEQNPEHLGLYHPPLYIYTLALWFNVFGAGPAQARLFGASCVLLYGLCILLLLRTLFGADYARRAAPWFWLIFLLNAYTIQSASITDIDTTVYGPLILLLLWSLLRLTWRDGVQRTDPVSMFELVRCSLFLTFCLWAKLTTILLVLPFVFLLMITRLGWFRAAALSVFVVVAGVVGFLSTYWVYGKMTGLPVDYTLDFTLASFLGRGSSGGAGFGAWLNDRWTNFRFMAPFMVVWSGLIPWICVAAGTAYSLWRWRRNRDSRSLHAALLLLLAGLSIAYYCAQVITFGGAPFKYAFVYWGVAIVATVCAAVQPDRMSPPLSAWRIAGYALSWVAAAIVGVFVVQDRALLNPSDRSALVWALSIPLALLSIGIFARGCGRSLSGSALAMCGLALYGGLQAGTAIHQNAQQYATTYDYGQRGFGDVTGYVRSQTGPDDVIVSMKDVGYAARRRYFENYAAVYGSELEAGKIKDMLASGAAKLAIFTEGRGQDQLVVNPRLRDWITSSCSLLASFDHYRVYGECSKSRGEQ